MAKFKCKEHSYKDLPMTAKNGRKYRKCINCGAVTFCKGHEMALPVKAVQEAIPQLSMVSESFGKPTGHNSDGTTYIINKPRRRKQPPVVHTGIWV